MNTFFDSIKKWFLLGFIITVILLFLHFRLYHFLTFSEIKKYESLAEIWRDTHYQFAVTIYMLIYVVLIACAMPCATLLTLIGGFLFGLVAILYSLISMTIGGLILFLAVRTAIGARIAQKSSGWIKTMEQGFQENAFNYLLMLRLIPFFPCWVSNASAGALNVPIKTFVGATFIGLIPSTLIYVLAGRSLDTFLLTNQTLTLQQILTPSIFLPLFGLAILSLFPVFYKLIKKHR